MAGVFEARRSAIDRIDGAMIWVLDAFSLAIGAGAGLCLATAFWLAIRSGARLDPFWRGALRTGLASAVLLLAGAVAIAVAPRFEAMCPGCGWSFAHAAASAALLFFGVIIAVRRAR